MFDSWLAPNSHIDLAGWQVILGHYGDAIDASFIRTHFLGVVSAAPPVAMFTMHRFGITLDEIRGGNLTKSLSDETKIWLGLPWLDDAGPGGNDPRTQLGATLGECARLQSEIEELKQQIAFLVSEVEEETHRTEDAKRMIQQLQDEKRAMQNKYNADVAGYQHMVESMTSLISADITDFTLGRLLGTGASAAAFTVHFHRNTTSGPPGGTGLQASTMTEGTTMVMKVLFNWESTERQTILRQKYMAECVTLASFPHHPNVIHPLGAIVIPRLPDEFMESLPKDRTFFREISVNSFFQGNIDEVAVDTFRQALKAVHHIESNSIVHKDIKEDNILVDPETRKLTLIDFGEAQRCLNTNLDSMVSPTTQPWGNAGTMPPELSTLLRNLVKTNRAAIFSYSKCDSFALALTFYDALLPPEHKFIGSRMNGNMWQFTTQALVSGFPIPASSEKQRRLLEAIVGMMNAEKSKRMGADQAISALPTTTESSLPLNTSDSVIAVSTTNRQQEGLIQQLQHDKEVMQASLNNREEQMRILQAHLDEDTRRFKEELSTMSTLISADVSDFSFDKLLGSGSSCIAFQVLYKGTTPELSSSGPAASLSKKMVMKVMFNWENTPRDTILRRKYMVECMNLSAIPHHPNVIHPLGAIIIPRFPDEFVDAIPKEQSFFRDLAVNKSVAILLPLCGITLPKFLSTLDPATNVDVTLNVFKQALKAVHHIESNSVVHRDIKESSILVDPETSKVTMIGFGEAQQCLNTNLDCMISHATLPWGNVGTMPPELSALAHNLMRGGSTMFSYSKCDSFALALTFYNLLLPRRRAFIGSSLNHDMSRFTTEALVTSFPATTAIKSQRDAHRLLVGVLVAMMHPDKASRMSARDAISALH
ncbi:hypothetical protein Pelo_17604 [Pelomyxa schiedti]|nr:hypothetical protein Pelo_17604 [Pelomyxa schiedti]